MKPDENAQKQPALKISILDCATQWNMKVDIDKNLVFQRIEQKNLRPDIMMW